MAGSGFRISETLYVKLKKCKVCKPLVKGRKSKLEIKPLLSTNTTTRNKPYTDKTESKLAINPWKKTEKDVLLLQKQWRIFPYGGIAIRTTTELKMMS